MRKNTNSYKKYIKLYWKIFLGIILFISLTFLSASLGLLGTLPTFEELETPENNLATEVISSDGETLGKYAKENRTPVKYKDLSDNLVNALIATEDERFYTHSGIDFRGTARAVFKPGSGGASTITQQLARMLFTGEKSRNKIKRVIQKIKEWVVAIKLEKQYTKNEILTMYLNKYDFLNQAVGIRSASRIYFYKEPKDLNIQESAMLIGMLKNSSYYNPLRRLKIVIQRKNIVLKQMNRNNYITVDEKDSIKRLPLEIKYTPESHSDGYATYFRSHLQKTLRKWVQKNPKPNGELYDIFKDGLKIHVTIDSRLQKYAEESVKEHMSNLQNYFFLEQKENKTAPFYDLKEEEVKNILERGKINSDRYKKLKLVGKSDEEIDKIFNTKTNMSVFSWKGNKDTLMTPYDSIVYYKYFLRSGLLSLNPKTGHIKAWVGGIDNKHFKYDAVAQQKRQVGSTFKPFVYATAINQLKLSPCEEFPNIPYTIPKEKHGIPKEWTPKNSNNKYGGMVSLKNGLANSVNTMSARLIDMVSPENVVRLAKSTGIKSYIRANPSIALGTVDLSLLEMVSAYSTFVNKGLHIEPMIITRIEDRNGTVLQRFKQNTREVLSEESAYVILDLLKGVTQYGSGSRLRTDRKKGEYITGYPYKFTNPIAGKTGTTQNQSDGWFIGIVPNLATGVWTGGEDRSIHFSGISLGQGATMALPTWALFMKKCYADESLNISSDDFEKPNRVTINLNCADKKVDHDQNEYLKDEELEEEESFEEDTDF